MFASFGATAGLTNKQDFFLCMVRGVGDTHQATKLSALFYCLKLILFTGGADFINHLFNIVFFFHKLYICKNK